MLSLILLPALAHAAAVKRDLTVGTLDGWYSLGCWSDSQSDRTLSVAGHWGSHVDDQNCQYQCKMTVSGGPYLYAGTEYSGQCFCGNTLSSIAVQMPDSDCSMQCQGTPSEPCGNADRINLFSTQPGVNQTTSAPPPAVSASTEQSTNGWVYQGCYTDSIGSRALPNSMTIPGGANAMTVEACLSAGQAAGSSLCLLEYGQECWCGTAIGGGNALASDQSSCSSPCKGNASEICGAGSRGSLYSLNGATPVVAASPSSTSAAVVTPTLPAGWGALGCYTDINGQRTLSHFINEPSSGMTVEYCTNACSSLGYSISGVEYGGECYCDNVFRFQGGLAGNGDTGCNMKCHGSSGETCGGPSRLNVYASGPAWVYLGCFTDDRAARTLAIEATLPGPLTVESCQAACAGYSFFGLEYSNECHCGNALLNGGAPAPDNAAGCSMSAAGNSSEIGGGTNRLSLYGFLSSDGTIHTSNTTVTSNVPANTGPTPQTSGLPSGWSYQNCYVDQTNARILAHQQPDSSSLTPSQCISACQAAGNYSIAGLEYSSQCFCDNAIQNSGSIASSDSKCNMACSGASNVACGSGGFLSVYSNAPVTVAAAPAPQTDNLPTGYTYLGCFADSVGNRVFSVEMDLPDTASASSCIAYCQSQSLNVAAIEYSDQCFCGTSQQLSTAFTSNACSMLCSDGSNTICGGPGAMTVFGSSS